MARTFYSVILIIVCIFLTVNSQYVSSPCPDIFDYKSDGFNVYGVIRLHTTSNTPLSSVTIIVNFTIAAQLPSQYVGRLEPIGAEQLLLKEFNKGVPITYRVHFPLTSPLPRLTSLVVNNNILCFGPGDIPGPTRYVTTISLRHMLFLGPEPPGIGIFNQYKPRPNPDSTDVFNQFDTRPKPDTPIVINYEPRPKPHGEFDFIGSFPNDGQLFTYNDDNKHTSNTGSQTYYPFVVNNSRPVYEQPATHPPPRPTYPQIPQYYPEQTTQAATTRPQPPPEIPLPPSPAPSMPVSSEPIKCGVVFGGNERLPLIYNGQSYARGDWPWLVAIYKRKDGSLTFICAGTLISDRHVVTAAHCMQQKNTFTTIKDIVVKVGVYNLEDWGDDITVTRTLVSAAIHESYNASTLANDLLVVTFERSVVFNNNIRPACLWSGRTDLSRIVGASGVVAGWGKSELGPEGQGEPRLVRIPVVSTATCRASKPEFHKLTSAKTLCAGDRNGVGPCLGDSGGGLYILDNGRWRLRGVVSLSLRPENGDNTCNLNEYIVFTDTAQYLTWIKNVIANTDLE